MKSYCTFFLYLILSSFYVQAQSATANSGSVKGVVITDDKDNKPVEFAQVYLKDTKYTVNADLNGCFTLTAPVGNYTLVIDCLGNNAYTTNVTINSGKLTELDTIRLTQGSIYLNDVVVTGQYRPQSLRNSVYQVRSIGQAEIKQKAATSVLNVLNTELGFRLSNDMALDEVDVQVMGMSGQNVKVLLDGVPLVDRGSNKQSLSQIDLNTIERIEVVEGPMSVVYGSDALAGVVNLITKKNTTDGLLAEGAKKAKVGVLLRVQEETAGDEYEFFTGKGVHNENLTVNFDHATGLNASGSITRNDFGGWQGSYTGRAKEWKPKDQWLSSGQLGYRTKKFNAYYRLNYLFEDVKGLGDVSLQNTAIDKHFYTNRYTHIAQASWTPSSKWSFNLSASYQDYNRKTQTSQVDFTTGKRTLTLGAGEQDESVVRSAFARGTTQFKASNVFAFQGGLEYRYDMASGDRIAGKPDIADYSLFISAEITPWSWLNVRPGLRFSVNSLYDAPPAIPSINTKLKLRHDMDLRVSYAMGFRAPALRELYFYFFDTNHSIKGNTDLEAEHSNSFTASYTWRAVAKERFRYTAVLSAFYNDFRNRITIAPIDNTTVNTYVNTDRYKTTGLMWENTIAWNNLQLSIGASYIGRYNKFTDNGTLTEELPEFVWSPEINGTAAYNLPKIGLGFSLYCKYTGVMPEYRQNSSTSSIYKNEQDGYTWVDLTVSKSLFKYLSLNAGVKNLLDVTRLQQTGGTDIAMSYGRSYFVGLNIQL